AAGRLPQPAGREPDCAIGPKALAAVLAREGCARRGGRRLNQVQCTALPEGTRRRRPGFSMDALHDAALEGLIAMLGWVVDEIEGWEAEKWSSGSREPRTLGGSAEV
ncbi:MAG TPA: hypothetical protein PLD23_19905, partial [Armatimonadota bacterium]|nr:hypothetical protein [Armatimonadota bacterium]